MWYVRKGPEGYRFTLPDFVEAKNASPTKASNGIGILGDVDQNYIHRQGDVEYVTAANPFVVKGLVDEIRRLRRINDYFVAEKVLELKKA